MVVGWSEELGENPAGLASMDSPLVLTRLGFNPEDQDEAHQRLDEHACARAHALVTTGG